MLSVLVHALFSMSRRSTTIKLRTTLALHALVLAARRVQAHGHNIVQRALQLSNVNFRQKHGGGQEAYLSVVVGRRELKLRANRSATNIVARSAEDLGSEWLPLGLDARVAEALDQALLALNGRIADLCNLVGVVHIPLLASERIVEGQDIGWSLEVDECITDVALVVEVNAQIEEVILSAGHLVKHALEIERLKLVRDVAQHDGSTNIQVAQDLLRDNLVVGAIVGQTMTTNMERSMVTGLAGAQRAADRIDMDSNDGGSLLCVSEWSMAMETNKTYSADDGVEVDALVSPTDQTISVGERLHLDADDDEVVWHNVVDARSCNGAHSGGNPANFLAESMQTFTFLVLKIEVLVLPGNGKTDLTLLGRPIRSVIAIATMVVFGFDEIDGPVGF